MRSPPVPSRELECLKEVPQDPRDIPGWKLAYCIITSTSRGMDVSE